MDDMDDFRSLEVDISMTMADGGGEDGTIVWELGEGAVYDGPRLEGNLMLSIEGNLIKDSAGNTTCTINTPYLDSNVLEVIVANGGPVLLTVWRNYVFEGHIDLDPVMLAQLKNEALFEYDDNEIYLGRNNDGFRLMSTNTNLENESDARKLLIAALMTGECGGNGLPDYTF